MVSAGKTILSVIAADGLEFDTPAIWVGLGVIDGKEGIVAEKVNNLVMTMVETREDRVPFLLSLAKQYTEKTGLEIRVVKFTARETVAVFGRKGMN